MAVQAFREPGGGVSPAAQAAVPLSKRPVKAGGVGPIQPLRGRVKARQVGWQRGASVPWWAGAIIY